jgi:hypothetical protein
MKKMRMLKRKKKKRVGKLKDRKEPDYKYEMVMFMGIMLGAALVGLRAKGVGGLVKTGDVDAEITTLNDKEFIESLSEPKSDFQKYGDGEL